MIDDVAVHSRINNARRGNQRDLVDRFKWCKTSGVLQAGTVLAAHHPAARSAIVKEAIDPVCEHVLVRIQGEIAEVSLKISETGTQYRFLLFGEGSSGLMRGRAKELVLCFPESRHFLRGLGLGPRRPGIGVLQKSFVCCLGVIKFLVWRWKCPFYEGAFRVLLGASPCGVKIGILFGDLER